MNIGHGRSHHLLLVRSGCPSVEQGRTLALALVAGLAVRESEYPNQKFASSFRDHNYDALSRKLDSDRAEAEIRAYHDLQLLAR